MTGQCATSMPHPKEATAYPRAANQAHGPLIAAMITPTGPVIVAVALVVLASVALHGDLPGAPQPLREESTDHPAALMVVLAVLGGSLGTVAVAVIRRVREPRVVIAGSAGGGARAGRSRDGWARPSPRGLTITLVVITTGLLIAVLLTLTLLLLAPQAAQLGVAHAPPEGASNTASPGGTSGPPPARQPGENAANVLGYLGAGTVIFLLALTVGTLVASRRRRRLTTPRGVTDDHAEPSAEEPQPESLLRAAERGLAQIADVSRDPRTAIIACYVAMEHGLGVSAGTVAQEGDTPTDVLSRAVEHRGLPAGNATKLVELFAEARFSTHVMTENHRQAAQQALGLVLGELRSLT